MESAQRGLEAGDGRKHGAAPGGGGEDWGCQDGAFGSPGLCPALLVSHQQLTTPTILTGTLPV